MKYESEKYETPRDKMKDLEADGLRMHDTLEEFTPKIGVYEFEMYRRNYTDINIEGYLTSSLLPAASYGLGFPDRKNMTGKKLESELKKWLIEFKTIGSKYGDYTWLDNDKIHQLVSRTIKLFGRQIEIERQTMEK